jgi:hypothetical protein
MRISSDALNPFLIEKGWDIREGEHEIWRIVTYGDLVIPAAPSPGINAGLVDIMAECKFGVNFIDYVFKNSYVEPDLNVYVNGYVEEVPIHRHENFDILFKWYGISISNKGYIEWVSWDPGKPEATRSEGRILFKKCPSNTMRGINPMAGIQTFLEAKAIVEITEVVTNRNGIPRHYCKLVGAKDKPPLGASFKTSKWMCSGLQVNSQGAGYSVTRKWMLNNTIKKKSWIPNLVWLGGDNYGLASAAEQDDTREED